MTNEYQKQYYLKNKERINQRNKENYEKDRENVIERTKKYNQKNPPTRTPKFISRNKTYSKEWRARNKDADKKRYEREKFILLIRAETRDKFKRAESCDNCDSTEQLEFHHWIYKSPVTLCHFSTLCKKCHLVEHKREKLSK